MFTAWRRYGCVLHSCVFNLPGGGGGGRGGRRGRRGGTALEPDIVREITEPRVVSRPLSGGRGGVRKGGGRDGARRKGGGRVEKG
ncbi:hypothetical protein E2C01_059433 [Portunus trituberculatus]|uniref:Uncharacterized protein n=1 Tax=Portunus trituberculatus TaxID=210409 RepID=A0A5B7GZ46_PORTR|nr:hypothetical protein [Portunus trituberculatus]